MTKVRTVDGVICTNNTFKFSDITVRVTVDAMGKSLSLSDDKTVLLEVPLEWLEDMIVSGWDNEKQSARRTRK